MSEYSQPNPPDWPFKLLACFCPDHLYEEIEGDLIQKFQRDVKRTSESKAKIDLVWSVVRFFRLGIVFRNKFSIEHNLFALIRHNLRFNLRRLRRQRLNTGLHVVGLTVGMSVCLLIGLFLRYELSFDAYHKNAKRTFRVNSVWKEAGKQFNLYATPIPLADALRNEVSGLESVVTTRPQFATVVQINAQKLFKQERVLITEPEFLDIFQIEVVTGDGRKALQTPYHALLTESIAAKYFGDEDAIGKTFKYRERFIITVGAIIRDLPVNTGLPASILLSYVDNEEFLDNGDTWYFGGFEWTKLAACTYVVLNENIDPTDIEAQLEAIADKNINSSPVLDKLVHGNFELQSLHGIHFDTDRFGGGPWVPAVNVSWLWFFGGIGIIVLVLACINFFNLSTAQAMTRAREVGIRKSIGARRSELLGQYLGETAIITFVSGVFSVLITQLSLPSLNNLLDKEITFHPIQSPEIIFVLLLFVIVTTVLAGFYPACIIAKFNPVIALKSGSSATGRNTSLLRKGLVVTQFTISAGLFIVVLLISQQVTFMREKDLGFEKDNIINVEIGDRDKAQAFTNDLRGISGVKEISLVRSSPISDDHWWNTMSQSESSDRQSVCAIYGDEHFFSVYGLRLLSGRIPNASEYNSNSKTGEAQTSKVVVNEQLIKMLRLGSPQEAVGKIFWWGGDTEVVGVVADFNTEPLKYEIPPTLITQNPDVYTHVSIKMESKADISTILKSVQAVWKSQNPQGIYEYQFLDSQIDSFYKTETRLYMLFRIFAGLAILISCLGLWGLVTFTSQQRTKEIGIRKVLGATVNAIFILLSKDFLFMIIIAFAIASPLAYYFMKEWLETFAFRIDIGWGTFVKTAIFFIVVGLVTMGLQIIKTALSNPVKSLKEE